jgi:hypothetical protein
MFIGDKLGNSSPPNCGEAHALWHFGYTLNLMTEFDAFSVEE